MGLRRWLWIGLLAAAGGRAQADEVLSGAQGPFLNFESGPVRPLVLSPDGRRLYALNTVDHRLEVYRTLRTVRPKRPLPGPFQANLEERPVLDFLGSVFTGLEPVAIALHPADPNLAFVANHLSDSVSVVELDTLQVRATIEVGDEPRGLVVHQGKVFVACARAPATAPVPGQLDPGPLVEAAVVVLRAQPNPTTAWTSWP